MNTDFNIKYMTNIFTYMYSAFYKTLRNNHVLIYIKIDSAYLHLLRLKRINRRDTDSLSLGTNHKVLHGYSDGPSSKLTSIFTYLPL